MRVERASHQVERQVVKPWQCSTEGQQMATEATERQQRMATEATEGQQRMATENGNRGSREAAEGQMQFCGSF